MTVNSDGTATYSGGRPTVTRVTNEGDETGTGETDMPHDTEGGGTGGSGNAASGDGGGASGGLSLLERWQRFIEGNPTSSVT